MVGTALAAAVSAAALYSFSHVWAKVKKNPSGQPDWESLDWGKLSRTFFVGVVVGVVLELVGGGITGDRYEVALAFGLGLVPLLENGLKGLWRRFFA